MQQLVSKKGRVRSTASKKTGKYNQNRHKFTKKESHVLHSFLQTATTSLLNWSKSLIILHPSSIKYIELLHTIFFSHKILFFRFLLFSPFFPKNLQKIVVVRAPSIFTLVGMQLIFLEGGSVCKKQGVFFSPKKIKKELFFWKSSLKFGSLLSSPKFFSFLLHERLTFAGRKNI